MSDEQTTGAEQAAFEADRPQPQSGGDHSPLAIPPHTAVEVTGPPIMVQPAIHLSPEAQATIDAILRGPMMEFVPTPMPQNPFNWAQADQQIAKAMNPPSAIIPEPPKPSAEPVKVGRKCACGKTMEHQLDWSNGKFPGWTCECGAREMPLDKDMPMKTDWFYKLAPSVQRLVQHSPTNPSTRALVEQVDGSRIPDHVKTPKDIKFWFERHIAPVVKEPVYRPPQARRRTPGFEVEISVTESETGNCHYSCTRSGSLTHEIDGAELLDIVRVAIEDGEGEPTVLRRIKSYVQDADVNVDTDLDDDSMQYRDHEARDSENTGYDIEISDRRFREWLLANDEELYDTIYG